jgi:hypothetical protein
VPQQQARIDVERRIAADPTSAVLLLAAPSAAELWPGVTLDSVQPGDHIRLRVLLPDSAAAMAGVTQPFDAVVRAEPPQRTPTTFVTRFVFSAPAVPTTEGTLTLSYTPADGDTNATLARLTFTVAGASLASTDFLTVLERAAVVFLNNLASAAEERSRAA